MMELIPDKGDLERAAIERIDWENMKRELWLVVDQLPGTMTDVIKKRYKEEKTMEETAKLIKASGSSVRSIQAKALRKLGERCKKGQVRKYYEEYISATSHRHIGVENFQNTWTSEVEREAIKRYEKSRRISRPDSGKGDQKSVPNQEAEGALFRAFDLPSERGAGVSSGIYISI